MLEHRPVDWSACPSRVGFAPMQDIQSQGATSPNRTFSLTADEAGITWQSNNV